MSDFRLVALDLDGTLVDSAPDLSNCLGTALDSVGLPRPGLADTCNWIGDGVEALVRRGLAAALDEPPAPEIFADALRAFDECYRVNLFTDSALFPDTAQTIAALRAAGITVGCITNKRESFARELLDRAGIATALDFVIGGDTLAEKKPSPVPLQHAARRFGLDPRQCVMIGDSLNDRRAAEAAGFGFIFAAFGYAGASDAEVRQDAAVIDAFSELRRLLCA